MTSKKIFDMASTDIAIIGIACRFAGDAKSPDAFHEMLQKAKDAWSKTPASRFNSQAFQHPSLNRSGTMVRRTHHPPS
jgi:acyl transferase domain-containing protein